MYIGTIIVWGFLMAFLYNLVQESSSESKNRSPMWIALTIFISYMLSDPLLIAYDFLLGYYAYFLWSALDFISIVIVCLITKNKSVTQVPAKVYIIFGLSFNILLFLGMAFDLRSGTSSERWWFWNVYAIGVNLSDIMMITALVVNKDFLGLVKAYKWLRG